MNDARPPQPDHGAVEAVVRGWVLLVGMALTLALPTFSVTSAIDGDVDPGLSRPISLLRSIGAVLLTPADDYVTDSESALVTARIGVVLVLVGLAAAGLVAVLWLGRRDLDSPPPALRLSAAGALGIGALLALIGAGSVPVLESGTGSQGLDLAGGWWVLIFLVVVLLAESPEPSWGRPPTESH